ncbi:MAG: 6-hydroxymethylpterin diphosphokinase MptE-like protein [bacterium]
MKIKNFLKGNLAALAEKDPGLVEKLKRHKVDESRYQVTRTGKQKLLNLRVPEKRLLFYDPKNIELSIKKDLESADLKNPKLVLMLGLGLGYHIPKLLQEKPNAVKHIIVFEKDISVLKLALSVLNFIDLIKNGNITFIAGIRENSVYNAFYSFFSSNFNIKLYSKSMAVISSGGSLALDKNYYIEGIRTFKNAMQQSVSDHGNSPEDSLNGFDNMMENIDHIIRHPGVNRLDNLFAGKNAVLVASGPSLDKNIDLLREIQHNTIIFSCDASLEALLKRGVTPHFVASLERNDATIGLYEGLEAHTDEMKKIVFMGLPLIKRGIYDICTEQYGMTTCTIYREYPHFRWLGIERGAVPCGKSVANLIFLALKRLGISRIILVGQDLSYSVDGAHHSSLAEEAGKAWDKVNTGDQSHNYLADEFYVKGNYVEKIKTKRVWNIFRTSYEKDIANYNGEVINATEGGAYIDGTKLMTLREVIDHHLTGPAYDPVAMVREKLAGFTREDMERDYHSAKSIVNQTETYLGEMIESCDEALEIINDFKTELAEKTEGKDIPFSSLDNQWLTSVRKKLITLKGNIANKDMFMDFMLHIVQSYFVKTEIEINSYDGIVSHINEKSALFIKKSENWFKTMRGLAVVSRKHLNTGKTHVEALADEFEQKKKGHSR